MDSNGNYDRFDYENHAAIQSMSDAVRRMEQKSSASGSGGGGGFLGLGLIGGILAVVGLIGNLIPLFFIPFYGVMLIFKKGSLMNASYAMLGELSNLIVKAINKIIPVSEKMGDELELFVERAIIIFYTLSLFLILIGVYRMLKKAGKPGWHVFIPFLNLYDLFSISGSKRKIIAVLFSCIPYVGIFSRIYLRIRLVLVFNGSGGTMVGMLLLPGLFYLLLGKKKYKYEALNSEE